MSIQKALQHKIDTRTKPIGSLGKLEHIALQIGSVQNTLTPSLEKPTILVFGADHGITAEGVSPYPKEVTRQMVLNFVEGGAAINVFCRQHNIDLRIIDAGVDYDFPKNATIINAKLAYGTENMMVKPAMTIEICQKSMEKGAALVHDEFKRGCNVIGFGEMGIGNTSAASLLLHKFTKIPLQECVGKGSGLDDEGLIRKYDILRQVSNKHSVHNAIDILATYGGLEIAMICGGVLEAQRLGMLIIADGFITSSAFLAAYYMKPEILNNVIFSHVSHESGHKLMLKHLGADPILELSLRLGEGTGAALCYPILESAILFLNQMASFESAAVSQSSTVSINKYVKKRSHIF